VVLILTTGPYKALGYAIRFTAYRVFSVRWELQFEIRLDEQNKRSVVTQISRCSAFFLCIPFPIQVPKFLRNTINNSFFPMLSALFTCQHLFFSLLNASGCLQPTFTIRTSGHPTAFSTAEIRCKKYCVCPYSAESWSRTLKEGSVLRCSRIGC